MRWYIIISCLFISGSLWTQVGINTKNPFGVFHIDSKGNTTGAGMNDADDVVVTSAGNVGIGTVSPQAKLDLRGTLTLIDGTQAPGYILQTGSNGITSWVNRPPLNKAVGTIASGRPIGATVTNITSSGGELVLAKGQWLVVSKVVGYGRSGNGSLSTEYYNKYSIVASLRGQRDSYTNDIAAVAVLPEQYKTSGTQNLFCAQLISIVDVTLASESFRIYAKCAEAGGATTNNGVLLGPQFEAAQLK